jgi:hypothetical protein
VGFEQLAPLGDLYVTWTGGDREVRLDPPGAREGDRPEPDGTGPGGTATESDEEDYL